MSKMEAITSILYGRREHRILRERAGSLGVVETAEGDRIHHDGRSYKDHSRTEVAPYGSRPLVVGIRLRDRADEEVGSHRLEAHELELEVGYAHSGHEDRHNNLYVQVAGSGRGIHAGYSVEEHDGRNMNRHIPRGVRNPFGKGAETLSGSGHAVSRVVS